MPVAFIENTQPNFITVHQGTMLDLRELKFRRRENLSGGFLGLLDPISLWQCITSGCP